MMKCSEFDFEDRLARLGAELEKEPSVVHCVMDEVEKLDVTGVTMIRQKKTFSSVFNKRNLVAAAIVLVVVTLSVVPSYRNRNDAWWLTSRSVWAAEIQSAMKKSLTTGYVCRERINGMVGLGSATKTWATLFVAEDRYRRDRYDDSQLRETQWYNFDPEGITLTSVNYIDQVYSVSQDSESGPQSDLASQMENLAEKLGVSGRHVGTERIGEADAVIFEIDAKTANPDADEGTLMVWLDQVEKRPVQIRSSVATWVIQWDEFEWNPKLPANTFDPVIPDGFSKKVTE